MKQGNEILVAEDDEADVVLMGLVFKQCGVLGQVVVTRDGEETLDYLQGSGKFRQRPASLPALVLLDLKLPKLSGLEILERIRGDGGLREIPVVVFTSSLAEQDRTASLAGGANEFVIKPIDLEAYSAALEKIIRTYVSGC